MSLIFDYFFVVHYQATGIMHKNGGVYSTCFSRSKIDPICQKMFFGNFAHFLQKNEMLRIVLLCITFVIFTKSTNFFRGGVTSVNMGYFSQIVTCFFDV